MKASLTLVQAPDSVFRIWRNRLNIEYQAASLFGHLGEELSKIYGNNDEVTTLCRQAEQEELEHARMCIDIIKHSGQNIKFNYKRSDIYLGPENMSSRQKILYTSLALGCVTETLSTALLTTMLNYAENGIIKETVHQILKDEVKHSRIGWAELNREKTNQDLSWVQPYIPQMIQEALMTDIKPMLSKTEGEEDLSLWGILKPNEAQKIMQNALEQVIRPGLAQYNLTC